MYQLRRVGQVGIKRLLIVLPKEGAVGGLEEDIVTGIAFLEFAEHFGWQVVVDILRFPVAVG